jgi:riboflavin transporter FmnP
MGSKNLGIPILYILLVAVVSYFEYGRTFDAFLGGLLLAVLFAVLSLIGLVPFVGIPLYILAAGPVLQWFSGLTGLPTTGLTVSIAYWLSLISAVILNIAASLIVYKLIKR